MLVWDLAQLLSLESGYAYLGANFLPEEYSGTFQKEGALCGSLLPPGGGICACYRLLRLACHLQRAHGARVRLGEGAVVQKLG